MCLCSLHWSTAPPPPRCSWWRPCPTHLYLNPISSCCLPPAPLFRFVIELCEPIQVKQLDIANFELFSSTPKDFLVSISDRSVSCLSEAELVVLSGSRSAQKSLHCETFSILFVIRDSPLGSAFLRVFPRSAGIRLTSGSSWAPSTPGTSARCRASRWTSSCTPNTSR